MVFGLGRLWATSASMLSDEGASVVTNGRRLTRSVRIRGLSRNRAFASQMSVRAGSSPTRTRCETALWLL